GLHRLPRQRPEPLRLPVPAVEVLAPAVLDQVLLPARDPVEGGVVLPRVPRARLADHDAVLARADHVAPWARRVGPRDHVLAAVRREAAVRGLEGLAHPSSSNTQEPARVSTRAPCADDRPRAFELVTGTESSGGPRSTPASGSRSVPRTGSRRR